MPTIKGAGALRLARTLLTPNENVPAKIYYSIVATYLFISIFLWAFYPSAIFPTPLGVVEALPGLWANGLGYELYVSITLNIQAVAIMSVISLLIGYGDTVAVFRPWATWVSAFRSNGFVGLPLLLTFILGNQHWIKVTLLVVGMSVFTVPSIVAMIHGMNRNVFDHARVLRMNEWRVLWEVVVLGKFHEVLDILRTNMAIGWMMLPMVEGLFKTEGGIGAMILAQNKYFRLEEVYCIIFVVIAAGLLQDAAIKGVRRLLCPHAYINTEKK